MAYLVKALSAVGIITNYSCAGHVGFLRIGLELGCSSAWTAILIRHVETKLRLTERREVENGMLFVPCKDNVDWVQYFLEVLDVADLLYQERICLARSAGRLLRRWMHEPNSSLLSISC